MTLTLSILTGCKNVSEEAISATPADSEMETRGVQNWSLWDPLDYYNTGVFNKANWTNGGMFNCGFIPDNAYFQNGKLVLKLNNRSSHNRPYSSGEYRTNNTFSYGTFETNMIAAKGDGLVTSFFLYTGMNAPYGKKMPSHSMQIMVNLGPGTGVDSWLNHFWYSGEKYAYYDYIKYTPK